MTTDHTAPAPAQPVLDLLREAAHWHLIEGNGNDHTHQALELAIAEIERLHAAPAPDAQPVAALLRSRFLRTPAKIAHDMRDHFSEWGDWLPTTYKHAKAVTDPSRNTDPMLYEMLPLYAGAAPVAPAAYIDSTPHLNVGNSAFEHWFQAQPFATQPGIKQISRDSYAAGMGDPLVTAAPTVAQQAAEPMDWPLPCDVTVGHATMRKGVALRTLVARMKALYETATGENADAVAARTPEERAALADAFQQQPAAAHPQQPAAEPDMRHPKIQALISGKACREIALSIAEALLDDPAHEISGTDGDYWYSLHDKIVALQQKAQQPTLPPAIDEGRLWSILRTIMADGVDIALEAERLGLGYEERSTRLDAASAKRSADLWHRLMQPAATVPEPLSDEQIAAVIRNSTVWTDPFGSYPRLARAIEAAHGITAAKGEA